MKKANLGLLALASIMGIGSAFTSAQHNFASTYYAQTNLAGSFFWTSTDPTNLGYHCATNRTDAYCTLVAPSQPAPGVKPTSGGVRNGVYVP